MQKSALRQGCARWQLHVKLFLIMKIVVVLLTIACLQVSATGFSQERITLSMKDVSFKEVFNQIQKQTSYRFIYHDNVQLKKKGAVNIEVENVSLGYVMGALLNNSGFTYSDLGNGLVAISAAEKKDRPITGTVINSKGEALTGVSIQVKGSTLGTTTDANGQFSINIPENAVLVVSAVGYLSKEVVVGTANNINVMLEVVETKMDEVVVVGYGAQKKSNLTGSVVSVSSKDIKHTPAISLANSLSGLLPGLAAKNNTGEPGRDDATILIRGRSTTGNNNPLVVVDGIQGATGWQRINPNDIESISVLKDASAAIYGAQAANGVILITTKRGVSGKPVISYNFNQGLNQPTFVPKMGNSASLAAYFNDLLVKQGQPPTYSEEDIEKFKNGSDPVNFPNVNWFGDVLKKASSQNQQNLSVRGGTNDVKYLVSGSYSNQNSIFKNGSHNFKVYTLRSNIDAQISKNIKVGVDINGNIDEGNYPTFTSLATFRAMNNNLPFMPVYWSNGLPSAGVERGENPIMMASSASGNYADTWQRFSATTSFEIIVPWIRGLGIDGYYNYRNVVELQKNWQTPWTVYNYDRKADNYIPVKGGGIVKPQLSQGAGKDKYTLVNVRLKYRNRFGKHTVDAFIAGEQAKANSFDFSAFRRDFVSTEIDELFAGSLINQEADGKASENARRNFLGRLHYDFSEKYLFDFNFRYDGSSNFPKGKRYGFFPGLSAAWRLSKERLIKDRLSFINDLKLRASIGQIGNDRISAFQYLRLYSMGNKGYNFGDPPIQSLGVVAGVTPNPNVTWEVATIKNIGLDGMFWNGLLGLTIDLFHQRRENILQTRSLGIPAFAGLSLPAENIGVVENKGFELEISHAIVKKDFSYRIAGNVAYAKNRVIDISEAANVPEWQRAKGHSIGAQNYYISTGIIRTQEELDKIPVYTGTKVGDLKYKDVNGNGKIDGADMVRLDKTSVPEVNYGINTSISFKGLSLFANFAGAANVYQPYRFQALLGFNTLQDLLDNRYTEGSMNSKYPTLPLQSGVNSLSSTFWLFNTSYLRLKTLELGYDLPQNVISVVKVKTARIYLNGSNLITFSKMKLFDPENTNLDGFFYPQSRIYNIGLTITF